jgi:hypothetical protein
MNKSLIDKLSKIYKYSNDDYIFDYIVPTAIIIAYICIIIVKYIRTDLLESKTSWASSKCVPKYMFFSGFINKKPQETALGSTYDNFEKCVNSLKTKKTDDTPITSDTYEETDTTLPEIYYPVDTPYVPNDDEIAIVYNKILEAFKMLGLITEDEYNELINKTIDYKIDIYIAFSKKSGMNYTELNTVSVEDIKYIIEILYK